ncbi:MAG: type II secretion system F family protein [Bryobacterales bacterium]|nr:type II secretion system F family protein [Bryobacterales bacterium]
MTGLLAIFLLVWFGSVCIYWLTTRYFRQSDVNRMRDRITEGPSSKKEKKAKVASNSPQLLASEDVKTGRVVLRVLRRFELNSRLERLVDQSGLKWRPARVVHTCLALFIAGAVIARWCSIPYVSAQLGIGLFVGMLPVLYIYRVRNRRLFKFEEQFPESLEFVARSMRAGHAFSVSLEMIYREFQEPLAGEMKRTFEEHNLGMPLDQALLKLAQRVPSLDVHFFVSAVLLQKRTGGNLAEILDKLAYLIRERFKLRGKIRAISAHGRMTGMALTTIPLAVATIMFYVNPGYVGFFIESSTGNIMAGAAVGLQVLGYLIIRKIVSIEV